MPRAHLVVGAGVATLEHHPERLHAIRVDFLADVLAYRVADSLMPQGKNSRLVP